MRIVRILFYCHVLALICVFGGLLLVAPRFGLFEVQASNGPALQIFLRLTGALQILFGAATMFLFGYLCVGPTKTLVFFIASLLVSYLVHLVYSGQAALPGFEGSSILARSGMILYFILLSWFYMGFTSYLLACKLVDRLGLKRQTLWSLLLGTYFLLAWDLALDTALAGAHLPVQFSVYRAYEANFGLPMANAVNWALTGLVFLVASRLLWRSDLDTRQLAISLPFGLYTANIGFVMLLSFSVGLWFPLLLSACFVLAPEALVYFPREEIHTTNKPGPWRVPLSQTTWLGVHLIVRFIKRLDVRAEGVENIPRHGPVIIAARHFHYFYDGVALVRTAPRRLHIIVALDWLQTQSLRLLIEAACAVADYPVVLRGDYLRERDETDAGPINVPNRATTCAKCWLRQSA